MRRVTVALANGARLTCNDPACVLELLEAGAELADPSDLKRIAQAVRQSVGGLGPVVIAASGPAASE